MANNKTKMNPQVRVTYVPKEGMVKAYCNATLFDAIGIRGIRVVEGKNGNYVSMPRQKDSKGEYADVAFPVTKDAYTELCQAVMNAYEQHITRAQSVQSEMKM